MRFFNTPYDIPDPAFGTRIFRRRIRVEKRADKRGEVIVAGLEDPIHACRLSMVVEDGILKEIEGRWERHPNRQCLGAARQLQAFIGKSMTAERDIYRAYNDSRQQCTHFHDLLGIAFTEATRDQPARQYDLIIPEAVGKTTTAELQIDGVTALRWEINDTHVVGPGELKNLPLEKGFGRWVAATYSADMIDAAHILQMGIYVSRASAVDFGTMAKVYPDKVLTPPALAGACYAMQPERNHLALPAYTIRDFTHSADSMLSFL